jgi:hypothetical protein
MLKGKDNCLVDLACEQNTRRSTGKALVDEEFDTAEVVGWAPMTLIEQFLLEKGKLEALVTLPVYDQWEANAAGGRGRSAIISNDTSSQMGSIRNKSSIDKEPGFKDRIVNIEDMITI